MLPELLRGADDYRMFIYAVILIVVMLLTNSEKAIQFKEILNEKFLAILQKTKLKKEDGNNV